MAARIDGGMDGGMRGSTDECLDGCMHELVHGWVCRLMNDIIEGGFYAGKDRWMKMAAWMNA